MSHSATLDEASRIDAISKDGAMPNFEAWGKLYDLARTLEAELEQERDIRSTREIMLTLVADGLGIDHEPHQTFDERLLEASCKGQQSETVPTTDAARWKFCMEHGFPKACWNPERCVSYFYVRADCGDDAVFEWDTPEKAVDATMQIIKERDEANARWKQETRT